MSKRGAAREMGDDELAWLDDLTDQTEEEDHVEEEDHGEADDAGEAAEAETDVGEEEDTGEEAAAEDDKAASGEDVDKGEEKPDEKDPRFAAILEDLRAERQKRQEAEAKATKYETYWEMQERLQQEQGKTEEKEEELPDFDIDPTAHLKARLDKTEKSAEQMRQEQEQVAQMQALGQAIKQSETQFIEQHPDYYEALNHVRSVMRKTSEPMAKAQGMSDQQLEQMLAQQELAAAAQALQVGQDPAEYAYQVAQAYGYTPKANTKESDAGQQGGDEPKKDDLDKMEKGLKMSRGQGGAPKMSKQQVDNMSLPEFEAAIAEAFQNQ